MGVLIKGITLEDFVRYGGEYAAHLVGIGDADELPDHGDLIDRGAFFIRGGRACGKMLFAKLLNSAPVVIPAERSEASLCDGCDEPRENCSWCKRMERSEDGET